ncbi:hypothetical protein SAMN05216282_11749 [Cryobacterium psychrotolerans]|uniref:Amidohydrolase 3 domain-containing protein n=1 Tax=Cryobacterium psychrotolerans TaxID=386301 RepID=A0A1G9FQG0_9MICO|nr:amidohydrolase [Cryobacterium psychrotolerans]TFD88728.1 amidohydrolase [Cryobacterium psychrotolerans]SDK90373.1 hypothetical protein SAMN05216282_11749 [Cryobacterium psychrotolerans]
MAGVADIVFVDGWIFSAPQDAPVRADVAVADGRIMAVGAAEDIAALVGENTDVVPLTGRLLLPGFQDAHIHPVAGGIELLQCDLTGAKDAEDCLRLIADYARAHPHAEWIMGAGWSMEFFAGGTPTRDLLDAVIPGRPVALMNRDHHGMWVNSRALGLAGVTAETPDPIDGRIERTQGGEPSGTLHEGAMDLVGRFAPSATGDLADRGLLRAQEYLHSFGVTSWQDALLGSGLGMEDSTMTYLDAVARGELTMRTVAAIWWERGRGLEQLPEIIDRRARIRDADPSGHFRASAVKIMVDGVPENFTAAMSQPYRDAHGDVTENLGLSFIDPEDLKVCVTALDAAGFQVHFHALGDRAVSESLDAIEAAREANGDLGNRHHLAHLQVVGMRDIPRFAELGTIANMQMLWAAHARQLDELNVPFLAPELVERYYPFGDLARARAQLCAGSDWPVSSPDPIAAIHVGVNRISEGSVERPLGEQQQLSLAAAVTAYTWGSAVVNRQEHETGKIAVGYLADLAVLDRNFFDLPAEDIHLTSVLRTYSAGSLVYRRGDESPDVFTGHQ